MRTEEELHTAVQLGINWINDHYPGKLATINLEKLDIYSGSACPLAQVSGELFNHARRRWLISREDAIKYGWLSTEAIGQPEWGRLETLWREAVQLAQAGELVAKAT